jgi:hypothetical protein
MGGGRDTVRGSDGRPGIRSALPEFVARALGRRDLQLVAPGEAARLAEQFQARRRFASRSGDAEGIVETSTPDTLVVESLLGWLAARLPPRQPLVLLAARGGETCGVRGLTPSALLRVHQIVRDSGETAAAVGSVRLMCPEGAFGLALESGGGIDGRTGRAPAASLFKLFVWGAPR